jgi:1,4-alpha-glucan branching enzyme
MAHEQRQQQAQQQRIAVTFVLPAEAGATDVAVAGDFNDWSTDAHRMSRRDDESFSITIELATGRRYQYRYWIDGRDWENDWYADAYVPNEYGGNNSLVDLTESSPRVRQPQVVDVGDVPDPEPVAPPSGSEPTADPTAGR